MTRRDNKDYNGLYSGPISLIYHYCRMGAPPKIFFSGAIKDYTGFPRCILREVMGMI